MSELQSVLIKVSPEALATRANEVRKRIQIIERRFQKIESVVNRSGGYWQGEAAVVHRKTFYESKDGIEEVLQEFKNTAIELEQIAQNYIQGEAVNKTDIEGLPIDVIE